MELVNVDVSTLVFLVGLFSPRLLPRVFLGEDTAREKALKLVRIEWKILSRKGRTGRDWRPVLTMSVRAACELGVIIHTLSFFLVFLFFPPWAAGALPIIRPR